jgi:peptidoglycan/xylan/chitin deacetylase (PgdA/CDA1 family)
VFVASGPVDQGMPAYMSWQQMRKMQNHGVTFANHSRDHDYLIQKKTGETTETWNKRIQTDLTTAQNRLQEELGRAPALFAYPYGEYNLALMNSVRDLGYTGFGQHSGGVGIFSDRRALPRFPVSEAYAEMSAFRTKALSLAMPVDEVQPVNPVTTKKNLP